MSKNGNKRELIEMKSSEKVKEKLSKKISEAGGDKDFVDTVMEILNAEKSSADKSKREHFRTEELVIGISMLSSIVAGISGIDATAWLLGAPNGVKIWIDILLTVLPVILPAVVTMLVAYRGIKKSYETWIRHRKYSLEMEMLINNYLYGNEEFDRLNGMEAYKKFRNEMQKLWKNSEDEFINNMNK